MALTWKEQLKKKLIEKSDSKQGSRLYQTYADGFSPSYTDDYSVAMAVQDIDYMEMLSDQKSIATHFYLISEKAGKPLHLRVFEWGSPIPLSDILPMLENLDLRVLIESSHEITLRNNKRIWISDFSVLYSKPAFNIKESHDLFQDALSHIYTGEAENDGFNKLALGASLSWREIMILRAYAKYLRQVGFRFTQPYIEAALINHADIAMDLVALFKMLHDPAIKAERSDEATKIEEKILHALETVTSLDEDVIIRRILDLIKATLRTNYFKTLSDELRKKSIALKLNSRAIPELPLPVPLYEIFVYSPEFEAIHLRYTKVARGGLRWSDRREDFRTEVLGLMKTQTVKNAGIVPSGAKGGFVLKTLKADATREMVQAAVVKSYKDFIRSLLDLTDNIKEHKIIFAKKIVRYDDEDPYLVVAADKGTASFSDLANSISEEYDFWLGDAFASGGSQGYDHKKMGITAKGAWESIKRHFRECDIDLKKTDITVVGIGDMSGDVFGNGLIYSNRLKLVAAFDHRNIFLDPMPDPTISYYERVRLFDLPVSSWESYNPKLISTGGGVYKRSAKSIAITPQVKKILDISENALTPNELVKAILKSKVDLLFNGGIGTYVKAESETHISVGDRANDFCRINGDELRCKVVGEGGNLGFTQLGRIEFASIDGLINTDFIDNSAGVDCSDHEVNLKILLAQEVANGHLSTKKRNAFLASLTSDVGSLVLQDNYSQALAMSFLAYYANDNVASHQDYIKELESQGVLNRKVEFLPDDKKILELKAAGKGLTRPELATLFAYTKIHIKHEILKSDLTKDPSLSEILITAFPSSVQKKYDAALGKHYLRKDIIATQLSNRIVNEMGIIFVYGQQLETGATVSDIVRAHAIASRIFGTDELRQLVESLDFKLPMKMQYGMLSDFCRLVNISTRWFLKNERFKGDLNEIISHYSERIKKLEHLIPVLMAGLTKQYLENLSDQFLKVGLSKKDAERIGVHRAMYTLLNVIEVASKNKFDLIKTAEVYFSVGNHFNLVWFRDQIAHDNRSGYWNAIARLTLRDELDIAQRTLTEIIMKSDKQKKFAKQLVNRWMKQHPVMIERWGKLLEMLHGSAVIDYTMFFIALRELSALI